VVIVTFSIVYSSYIWDLLQVTAMTSNKKSNTKI